MKIKIKKAVSFPMSVGITVSALTSLISSAKMGYEADERTVVTHRRM